SLFIRHGQTWATLRQHHPRCRNSRRDPGSGRGARGGGLGWARLQYGGVSGDAAAPGRTGGAGRGPTGGRRRGPGARPGRRAGRAGKPGRGAAVRARLPGERRIFVGYCDDLATPRTLGPFRDLVGSVGSELSRAVLDGGDRDRILTALRTELDWAQHPAVLVI